MRVRNRKSSKSNSKGGHSGCYCGKALLLEEECDCCPEESVDWGSVDFVEDQSKRTLDLCEVFNLNKYFYGC